MHHVGIERAGIAVVVVAAGEVDAFVAPELEAAFAEQAVLDAPVVLADLRRVSFLDSTGLGVVVRAVRALDERGRSARVILPHGAARRIFEITTLDRVLPVASSREDALSDLSACGP